MRTVERKIHYLLHYLLFLPLITVLMLGNHPLAAQQFFVNNGFEDINICAEYHAPCAPEGWFYLHPVTNPLVTGSATPSPLLGHNFLLVPMANVYENPKQRPFVYSLLSCSLVPLAAYRIRFYIHTMRRTFYELDFCFSDAEPSLMYYDASKSCQMVRVNSTHVLDEVKGWQLLEVQFVATAAAKFCSIGNFSEAPFSYPLKDRMSKSGNVYYFLDDVKLNPLEPDAPCDDAGKNIEMAYAQNYRHSEYIAVKPVEVLKPTFINDTIRIPAAYFDVGKSSVKENRMAFIDSLALSFSGRPIAQISIYGYTDATGDSTLNVVLSEQRAASIRNRIISVVPEFALVIRSEGLGALQPRASNNTIAGRALNRRVEIVLTCQIK